MAKSVSPTCHKVNPSYPTEPEPVCAVKVILQWSPRKESNWQLVYSGFNPDGFIQAPPTSKPFSQVKSMR